MEYTFTIRYVSGHLRYFKANVTEPALLAQNIIMTGYSVTDTGGTPFWANGRTIEEISWAVDLAPPPTPVPVGTPTP
jgi:hypothetical protein